VAGLSGSGGPGSKGAGAGAIRLSGRILRGHGVAGGGNPASPFPAGTIEMQLPHFAAGGLDLSGFHLATLNVSTAPAAVHIHTPAHRFEEVDWTRVHGPESFEFVHVGLELRDRVVEAWGYRPTPETKAAHPQPPEVLEVIAPFVPELVQAREVVVLLDPREVRVET
jgi:hypothetical protein